MSFPSGHASFAFYTMLFLIVYLEARLFLLRFRYAKSLIQMTAFIAAYITSISRITDNAHRSSDVIGGVVLGSLIALFFTLVLGQVLWEYGRDEPYADFDLKPSVNFGGNSRLRLRIQELGVS
jgi:membrane-associated phospholipid phosphatase